MSPLRLRCLPLLLLAGLLGAGEAVHEVLVVNSYHRGYRWSDDILEGIVAGLRESGQAAKLHFEFLDSKRHPLVMADPSLPAFMRAKYGATRFDAVITCDDNATWWLLDRRDDLLPGVPQVFCGTNDLQPERLRGRHGVTGVNEYADVGETLECMLRLHPGARRLLVVTDLTETGRGVVRAVERWRHDLPSGVGLEIIDRVTCDELRATVAAAGDGDLILYTFFFQDRDGRTFDADESAALVALHARVPVYTTWEFNQGFGMVGGKQTSGYCQGRAAAALAAEILAGQPVDALPVRMDSPNRWVFEHPALARFGIPRSALPPGSLVINEPDSPWWRYRHVVWAVATALAVLLGVVAVLALTIRQRRRTERALRDSEERLSTTLNSIADAVIATDDRGRVTGLNPVAEGITGWNRAEAVGRPIAELVALADPASRSSLPCPTEAALRGEEGPIAAGPALLRDRAGSERQVSGSAAPIRDRRGRIAGVVLVLRDRTAELAAAERLRDSEERLRQHEKLGAIGQLAGGVAHDFNNQLTGILGFAEVLAARLADPTLRRAANHIVQAALRSAELTRQLLAFARKGRILAVTVHLHPVIEEVVNLLSHSIDKRIRIETSLAADPDTVLGDPGQIQNALLNLALNARDAMPGGGGLRFATRNGAAPPESGIAAGTPCVVVEVADDGAGMDAETRRHLFEPFFTTKPAGKGTGLGLAAVYGAVQSHGGAIAVATAPGQGTTFTIHLPVHHARPEDPATQAIISRPGLAHVLVVDDEELVRRLLADLLAGLGYRVTACADGAEALAAFREGWRGFDLVILDLVMPGMAGQEVLAQLKAIDPAVRVLLSSGYNPDGAAPIPAEDIRGFIQKPYRAAELARQVAEAIGGAPRR